MFERKRRKKSYITTLYVTGKIFAYYEIDKPYVDNVCLTQPEGHAFGFHDLINFCNFLKEIMYS